MVTLTNPFYVLQISHDQGEHWESCPIVLFDDLSREEQTRIYKELSR